MKRNISSEPFILENHSHKTEGKNHNSSGLVENIWLLKKKQSITSSKPEVWHEKPKN